MASSQVTAEEQQRPGLWHPVERVDKKEKKNYLVLHYVYEPEEGEQRDFEIKEVEKDPQQFVAEFSVLRASASGDNLKHRSKPFSSEINQDIRILEDKKKLKKKGKTSYYKVKFIKKNPSLELSKYF